MNAPPRRGACPGLSAPMQTGDGLLVRLLPTGTIPLAAMAKLCAAARLYGNGIMEVTARGSVQVRGLTVASAPRFAAAVEALGIAAEDGVPIHTNALTGLDPDEMLDAGKLAADLRRALTQRSLAGRLSPKVSVAIDGGGALGLDQLAADVRLRTGLINGDLALEVSAGGDQADATTIGHVAPAHGVDTAVRLLEAIAQHGRARARDIVAAAGIAPLRSAISDLLVARARPRASPGPERNFRRPESERKTEIGMHRLRDLLAFGLGLAFGQAEASALEHLIEAARAAGAAGMRAAPGRALIVVGLASDALPAFVAQAERLDFIIRHDDPRRSVVACAGAPFCASGRIAARTIAPAVAKAKAQYLGDSFTIHVSGCAKGCAHPAPAALTVVGTPEGFALVADGAARDAPFAVVEANEIGTAIAKYASERSREVHHV